jgi:hypothetical protein
VQTHGGQLPSRPAKNRIPGPGRRLRYSPLSQRRGAYLHLLRFHPRHSSTAMTRRIRPTNCALPAANEDVGSKAWAPAVR